VGAPHPVELRARVVAFVEEGHSHRSAAARFRVSVKFVNDRVILKRGRGGLRPRRQGNGGGHGEPEPVRAWLEARMARNRDLTLDDPVAELSDRHGIAIHRVPVWRFLRGLGPTHEKSPARRRAEAA
jgi:transposase